MAQVLARRRYTATPGDPKSPHVKVAPPRPTTRRRPVLSVKGAVMVVDLAVVVAAMAVAYRLRTTIPGQHSSKDPSRHVLLAALSLPIWSLTFMHYQLYRANKIAGRRAELGRLVHAVGMSVAAMALLAFMAKLYVARGWLALTFVVALVMLAVEREVMRRVFAVQRSRGRFSRPILIVGGNSDAIELSSTLATDLSLGYEVLGFIDDAVVGTLLSAGKRVLGSIEQIQETITLTRAQGVIVVTSAVGMETANRLARDLLEAGIQVEVVSALKDIAVERLSLRCLGRFPTLHLERVHRNGWRAAAKRGFDIAGAGTVLALTAPLLAIIALLVKWGSPGPVLFRQGRLGRNGKLFDVLKFRTMVIGAEAQLPHLRAHNQAAEPLFKMYDDPRVTRVGRILRASSIDELPQLWNVLRGEMSLVGPRPAIPDEVHGWSPELHQRLRVKPGITGMWQVGGRTRSTFDDYCRLDLYYVDNWSLMVDLAILFKTIPAVFSRRGAY